MNTNTTHTPGPWRIVDIAKEAHEIAIMDSSKDRIGLFAAIRLESSKPTVEEWANACLISAGPELLTMLNRVLDEYLLVDPTGGPICQLTLKQARAAIAKAEGSAE